MRSIYNAMSTLLTRSLDTLAPDELQMLAGATEVAESEARRLSAVCEGIACLVNDDGQRTPRAGNFQDAGGVFDLLCFVSHGLDTIAALIHVGSEAKYRARELSNGPPADHGGGDAPAP